MPKRIQEFTSSSTSTTEDLLQHLRDLLRRETLIHYPSDSASPAKQNLMALISSLESGREVRLTQRELPHSVALPGAAYLFSPKTQTYKETRN